MKKFGLLSAFRLGFLICSALTAVWQTLAVLFSYQPNDHYFKSGDFLSIAAVVFAIMGAAYGIIGVLADKKKNDYPNILARATFPNPMAGGAVAATLLFAGYRMLSAGYGAKFSRFDLLLTVTLALTAVYAVLCGIQNAAGRQTLTALFGLFAIVALILLNAYYYFDRSIEMNAPLKTSIQVGLLFATLFLTGEVRYLLGTEMPRMMQIFAVCTIAFGALSAVAIPVAFFGGMFNRPDYLAGALLVLGFVPTALIRLHTLTAKPKTAPEKTE